MNFACDYIPPNRLLRASLALTLIFMLGACVSNAKKVDPKERAAAHVDLGMSYLRRGNLEVAREEFSIALGIRESSAGWHGMALTQARIGLVEPARQSFARAVKLNKRNYAAVNDYGIHLCQNGAVRKGLHQLRRIENDVENTAQTATLLGLGVCHWRRREAAPAAHYLRAALKVAPTLLPALLPLAEISFSEKELLSARAFIQRYFASGANSARSLLLAARIEHALGDAEQLRIYARQLRADFPQSDEAHELDALIE